MHNTGRKVASLRLVEPWGQQCWPMDCGSVGKANGGCGSMEHGSNKPRMSLRTRLRTRRSVGQASKTLAKHGGRRRIDSVWS